MPAVSTIASMQDSLALLAHSIVEKAVLEAQKRSIRICVAVVDPGGHLLAFLRMDGLPFHLISVAQDKAVTAASFGIPSSELAFGLGRHSKSVVDFFRSRDNVVLLAGGVPLRKKGELLGAVGVTGSSETEDEACAMAAIEAGLKQLARR